MKSLYSYFPELGFQNTTSLMLTPRTIILVTKKNDWISSDSFYTWLPNLFYPSISNRVIFPIFLFLDGHRSHINVAVSEFCIDKGIILYCFPAHASHILQPVDVTVFGLMKNI